MGLRLFSYTLIKMYHAALLLWEITLLDHLFWHRKYCVLILVRQ